MISDNHNPHKLNQFKNLLKNSLFVEPEQLEIFQQIPDAYFHEIFYDNFNGDLSLASKILFEKYDEINYDEVREKLKTIHNYERATSILSHQIKTGKKIVFVTDIDNDGSLSQAILIEFKKLLGEDLSKNIDVIYTQVVNGNSERGFTYDLMELWAKENNISKNENVLMLTADNGIQSRLEQEKILKEFPQFKLLITDHHLPDDNPNPDENLTIVEGKRTCIFNPKFKPSSFFSGKKNISGAHTLGVLCESVLEEFNSSADLKVMHRLEDVSNMLDYVPTDIRLKPLKKYIIDEFSELGPLLNVNNSLSKLITGDYSIDDIQSLGKDIEGFDVDKFVDIIISIQEQNLLAQKLLYLMDRYNNLEPSFKLGQTDKQFYLDIVDAVNDETILYKHINNNNIEQLRPHIYHSTASTKNNSYEVELLEKMKSVFSRVRYLEKDIMNLLKNAENTMQFVQNENAIVTLPTNDAVARIFNRKFLSKTFNVANPGFQLILNDISGKKWTGSFRGLYDFTEFLVNQKELNEQDIYIKFKGHHRAAGFEISKKKGSVSLKDVETTMNYINNTIKDIKLFQDPNALHLHIDFSNFHIISAINEKIKSKTNNFSSIKPIIKLNRSLFFTDNKTLEQISVGQMLKKDRFGYTVVKLNFQGDAMIIPTEMVRQLHESNFKDFLEVSTLSEGVFIANKVIPSSSLKKSNIIRLDSPSVEEHKSVAEYYESEFSDSFSKNINREELLGVPIFNRQIDKNKSFDDVESLYIEIIDKLNLDKYVILDTEANGLGKAPKLFNFGALAISIKEGSGQIYTEDEFIALKNDPIQWKLFEKSLKNFKYDQETKTFVVNRTIEAVLMSSLLKEKDFKLTPEIIALTGITQSILNKHGSIVASLDNSLVELFKGQKCVYQAHNAAYDIGVINSNLPSFKSEILDHNLVCDSAKFSKDLKLAYGDITVATVGNKFKNALFFDDPFCDYTISKTIKSEGDFIFPDIRGEYMLKRKNGEYTIADLRNNIEHKINSNTSAILKSIQRKTLPLNMVKYSVVSLLKYENIRNMLLDGFEYKAKNIQTPEYIPEEFDELFQEFCNSKKYSFDMTPEANLSSFARSIKLENRNDEYNSIFESKDIVFLDDLGEITTNHAGEPEIVSAKKGGSLARLLIGGARKFLMENKDIHMRHVSVWEYQKVLNLYDPSTSVVTKNQIQALNYKTGFPEEKLKEIIHTIYKHKMENNIKGEFFTPELHNNFGTDGDAALEAMTAWIRLLKQTGYLASDVVIDTIEDTMFKNAIRSIIESDYLFYAQYSYSANQLSQYGNRKNLDGELHVSPMVTNVKSGNSTFIKNSILPNGSKINCEKSLGKNFDLDEFAEIKSKLNLIVSMALIKDSDFDFKINNETAEAIQNLSPDEKKKVIDQLHDEYAEKIASAEEICQKIMPTATRYYEETKNITGDLFFTREEEEIKKYAELIWKCIKSGKVSPAINANPKFFTEKQEIVYKSMVEKFPKLLERINIEIDYDVVNKIKEIVAGYEPVELPKLIDEISYEKKDILKFLTTDKDAQEILNTILMQQLPNLGDKQIDRLLSISNKSLNLEVNTQSEKILTPKKVDASVKKGIAAYKRQKTAGKNKKPISYPKLNH